MSTPDPPGKILDGSWGPRRLYFFNAAAGTARPLCPHGDDSPSCFAEMRLGRLTLPTAAIRSTVRAAGCPLRNEAARPVLLHLTGLGSSPV